MATRARNPKRVRARRDRNYKAVHRTTRWGNPFSIDEHGRARAIELYEEWLDERLAEDPEFLEPLRGFNVGCFCSFDVACHADVIIRRLYGD